MMRLSAISALSALMLVSCVGMRTPDPFQTGGNGAWTSQTRADLMVRIENDHYDPVVISAVWDRSRYFLGEVQPGETGVFQIPGHLLASQGNPQLLADPRGRAMEQLTDPIACKDAHWVRWRLKRHLTPSRPVILGL